MQNYRYEEIAHANQAHEPADNKAELWRSLFYQVLVSSGVWTCYFTFGLSMGAITVFVPQIRREANSTDAISPETMSWLASVFGYSAIPWVFVLPLLSHMFGRRVTFRFIGVASLIGSIIFYFSTSVTHLFISEIVISVVAAGQVPVFVILVVESSSPKYRGLFLTLKSASFFWGIWISNLIGTFCHWKYIGIAQIVTSLYILITAFFCLETPIWLASRKRFEDCKTVHILLRGSSESAKKELEDIINCPINTDSGELSLKSKINQLQEAIKSRNIYKPTLLACCLYNLYYSTAKTSVAMYAIDIIKEITSNESTAYTVMLILDGVTVFSMYVASAISKKISRRKLLFSTTVVGIASLFILSLYLYLIRVRAIGENKYITTSLLIVYSISISFGPMILCTSIASELIPLQFRNIVIFFLALYDRIITGTYLKISPNIFATFGMDGAFLCFALLTSLWLVILIKYLPELKDKSLCEIQKLIDSNIDAKI